MQLIVLDFAKLSMNYKLAATENKISVANQHRKAGKITWQNNEITEIQVIAAKAIEKTIM